MLPRCTPRTARPRRTPLPPGFLQDLQENNALFIAEDTNFELAVELAG